MQGDIQDKKIQNTTRFPPQRPDKDFVRKIVAKSKTSARERLAKAAPRRKRSGTAKVA
jgi:hypothetical protein